MDIKRELEIAQAARQALEEILFDGPVPDDGHLIYKRAIQLRKIEEAARDFVTVVTEDHDLSRPVVLPGEIDTLIDALAALEGANDAHSSTE